MNNSQRKSEITLAFTIRRKNLIKIKNICFNAWRAVCSDLKFLETGKNNKYFFYGFIKGHPEFFTFRKSYFFQLKEHKSELLPLLFLIFSK